MAWLRIDDRVRTHPKIAQAGPAAAWLWFCGICYCREHLTDGFIPKAVVVSLAMNLTSPLKHAARLVDVRLWEDVDGGYQVHDFLDWNPSRAEVEANREWGTQRKSLYRNKDVTSIVRERDADQCRYCGRRVNFNDRRGPGGGQLDHVIPRGPGTIENIVVACRECNTKKNGRTPDEAGMALIQIGTSSDLNDGTSSDLVPPHARPRDRAGDAGLGSGYGSRSGDLSDPEESARETTNHGGTYRPVNPHNKPTNLVHGGEQRRHGTHAWCDHERGKCVPYGLHDEFCKALGVPRDEAEARLKAWYPTVIAGYAGVPIGDDVFALWRNEFAGWVGTVSRKPVATESTREGRTLAAAARTAAALERGEL